jgi:glycosyltransferase involved in cell wall biosynthesis
MNQRERTVLIVVSSYRPAMLADMQRARMLAWELPKLGWRVEVLTPQAREIRQDVIEPDPNGFFPADTPIHEIGSFARKLFEAGGSRSPMLRTLWPMRRLGSKLLRTSEFDLVYFSTTTFSYCSLGPLWKRQYGIPYVLDFHDPWVKENEQRTVPQNWRNRLIARLAARWERLAILNASGVIAVSPRYIDLLRQRYETRKPACLAPGRNVVIPFGALARDLEEVRKSARLDVVEEQAQITINYVGAGGPIMARSFSLICRAFATLRAKKHPLIDQVRICLFGTTYGWKDGDPKFLEELAQKAGVGDLIAERPERVSYRRSLELLLESNGALILGVDDSGYMPSKLFTYGLSGKPLLASLYRESPGFSKFQEIRSLGHALWFDDNKEMSISEASDTMSRFIEEAVSHRSFDRHEVLRPYLAPAMAENHDRLFRSVIEQ